MASGVKNFHGAFTATGASKNVTTVGFRPSRVRVINTTSGDEEVWFENMADASAFKRLAAGAGALITTGGITPRSDGFVFGADADVNAIGENVVFEALE